MAEKELNKVLSDIVQELVDVKAVLQARLGLIKKKAKPPVLIFAGLIGLKLGLSISRAVLSLIWRHKLLIAAAAVGGTLWYKQSMQSMQGCQDPFAKKAG